MDPDIFRKELEALIEASASQAPVAVHRVDHLRAGDFARWGRRGSLCTLALYGHGWWFVLLARRRWEKITAEQLAEAFVILSRGRT